MDPELEERHLLAVVALAVVTVSLAENPPLVVVEVVQVLTQEPQGKETVVAVAVLVVEALEDLG